MNLFNNTSDLQLAEQRLAFVQSLAQQAGEDPEMWRIEVTVIGGRCPECGERESHREGCEVEEEIEEPIYSWGVCHQEFGYLKSNPDDQLTSHEEFVAKADKLWQERHGS